MLLKPHLTFFQVHRMTWKLDIKILCWCILVYIIDAFWLSKHVSIPVPAALTAVMGTAIAFFIGFTNNQAYDRWWEARTIWGGLVNDSRSWARELLSYCHYKKEVGGPQSVDGPQSLARKMVNRHLAFIYVLKATLRGIPDSYYLRYLDEKDAAYVQTQTNIPNAILVLQSEDVQSLSEEGVIDGFRLQRLNGLIAAHCDGMGKSERIARTVYPSSYLFFTRLYIWFFVMLNVFMMTESLGYWSIAYGWAFGFVFHAMHQNGVNIMNPFELAPMGTPLDSISRTIEINLLEMLGSKSIPPPVEPVNGHYIT